MQHTLPQESSSLLFEQRINGLISHYMSISQRRSESLFRDFLITGYKKTTLNSVPHFYFESIIYAKLILGMIITLYDDLADHPQHKNPLLLSFLYQLNIEKDPMLQIPLDTMGQDIHELARFLFSNLTMELKKYPHYELLKPVLQFDMEQFYLCNRHSELISSIPSCQNLHESYALGSYNMGIVAAGTIDLMASPAFHLDELGTCRTIFQMGQRLGRISNVISTLKREIDENDVTNEILIGSIEENVSQEEYQEKLRDEFSKKEKQLCSQNIKTFCAQKYAEGLLNLHQLHMDFIGRI